MYANPMCMAFENFELTMKTVVLGVWSAVGMKIFNDFVGTFVPSKKSPTGMSPQETQVEHVTVSSADSVQGPRDEEECSGRNSRQTF